MEDNETQAPTAKKIRQAMFTSKILERSTGKASRPCLKKLKVVSSSKRLRPRVTISKISVFASLSKRAAEMLRDDLEVMGPVRLAEVSEAQQSIVTVALQLKQEGKLMISGGQDEFV